MNEERLLVWGCGDLGLRVARRWTEQGGRALGWTRTPRRHAELESAGVEPFVGSPLDRMEPTDRLLIATPGSASQTACVARLDQARARPGRVVLIGSTAFHAGASGSVDETSPAGDTDRARAAERAELTLRAQQSEGGVVLRLGGLYSSRRGPAVAVRRRGSVHPGPPDRTLALIHYDDAAEATLQALLHPRPEPVYLGVCDPQPTRREFYEALADRLPDGALELAFTAPVGRPRAVYDVSRLRRDLLPNPRHPDWRDALAPGG